MAHSAQRRRRPAGVTRSAYFRAFPKQETCQLIRLCQSNPRARTLAIELAWLWVRHQPASALTRWFLERVGSATGRVRRITVVALARKLMIALWRYLTTGQIPEGAVMKSA